VPAKLRTAKGRQPSFTPDALALFVELERKRTRAFSDGSRELARMLGLVSEWWTGNHVNDRSAEPCHPPWCVAYENWFRCRQMREALLAAAEGSARSAPQKY
jgi:hypothetical protein